MLNINEEEVLRELQVLRNKLNDVNIILLIIIYNNNNNIIIIFLLCNFYLMIINYNF